MVNSVALSIILVVGQKMVICSMAQGKEEKRSTTHSDITPNFQVLRDSRCVHCNINHHNIKNGLTE
jgi:hypothetical protein